MTKTPEAAATVAKIFNIGAMGTQQYGAYNQALRDYFEKTDVNQLIQSVPNFGTLVDRNGRGRRPQRSLQESVEPGRCSAERRCWCPWRCWYLACRRRHAEGAAATHRDRYR